MKYVFIVLIIILAIYIYFLLSVVRYSLKCQQYLMDIDKDIDKVFDKIKYFIKLLEDKKNIKILTNYLDSKISTINQKNIFIDDVFNSLNDIFASKEIDMTNFEISNLNNELSNIHGDINNNIDQYNIYATKYNKYISFKFISFLTSILRCKKKLLFKR